MTREPSSEGPDIKGLQEFAESPDRDVAPFFVGREDEISLVQRVIENALQSVAAGHPAQSRTIVLQGAPGAGKSSLLNHLEELVTPKSDWFRSMIRRAGIGGDEGPLAVTVDMESVHDEARLVEELAAALDKRIEKDFRTTGEKQKSARVSGAAGVGGISAQFGFDFGRGLRSPILLLSDEIQNVTPGRHDDLLGLLHKGSHGLPIVPVYAGLADSWDVLGRCGLTRPSSGHVRNIAGLAQDEARQAVGLFFGRFRIDGEDACKDAWAAALAEDSDCWPEHLHTAMQGLAVALADCAGLLFGLDGPQAARARAAGWERRADSYGRRQSDEMAVACILVARLMAEIPIVPEYGMRPDRVSNLLESLDREGRSDAGRRLPEDMNAKDFRNHLVHHGALQAGSHRDPPPALPDSQPPRLADPLGRQRRTGSATADVRHRHRRENRQRGPLRGLSRDNITAFVPVRAPWGYDAGVFGCPVSGIELRHPRAFRNSAVGRSPKWPTLAPARQKSRTPDLRM